MIDAAALRLVGLRRFRARSPLIPWLHHFSGVTTLQATNQVWWPGASEVEMSIAFAGSEFHYPFVA